MRYKLYVSIFLSAALALISGTVLSEAKAEALTRSAFEVLGAADIVVVGEQHDNALHHVFQAEIARAIYPSALVFEMLTPAQAKASRSVNRFDLRELDKALQWTKRGGWPAFQSYYPIFANAPQASIYGAALPREMVRNAVKNGAAQDFDESELYGLDLRLDTTEQAAREELQDTAHCNMLPQDALAGMVEAQRLRDASFAKTTLRALEETGGPVLVITGNGHARTDWGIPHFIRIAAPDVELISVGQLEEQEISPPYDRWIYTGTFGGQRDDPCKAFSSN